jgi:hypothetical protein
LHTREIIFQSKHLTVVHSENGSEVVFATFNEMGLTASGDNYWGKAILEKMDVSVIGFVSAKPNWYPASDMLSAVEAAKQRIVGRRVITYGFSQGGYGALKFASSLSASLALAFSPQWSINPAEVSQFDRRYTARYDPLLRNGERIEQHDLCQKNIIFFDPRDKEDNAQAARLLRLKNIAPVLVPFSGHRSIRLISEGGVGRSFLQACIDGSNLTVEFLRALIRQGRGRSSLYAEEKLAQLERSISRHQSYANAAIQAMPPGAARTLATVRMKIALGDLVAAEDTLQEVSDQELLKTDFRTVWSRFRASGFRYGEARLAPLFRQRYPDDVFLRQHGANSFVFLRDSENALAELEILEGMKGAAALSRDFIYLYRALERYDLASAFATRLEERAEISRIDRIKIGFDLLSTYRSRKMKPQARSELMQLAKLCIVDDSLGIQLVEAAIECEEFGLVGDILEKMPQLGQKHPVVEVHVARCLVDRDPLVAQERVGRLLNQQVEDHRYWYELSHLAGRMIGWSAALRACRKAVSLSPEEMEIEYRHKLVFLLLGCGKKRQAAIELKRILITGATASFAGSFAEMALRAGDASLSEQFINRWIQAFPTDVSVRIWCCRVLTEGRQIRQASSCFEAAFDLIKSSHSARLEDCRDLIKCGQSLHYALEKRAVCLALIHFPDSNEFKALAVSERESFAAKFFTTDAATHVRFEKESKRSLFARIASFGR